jgi:hypothetical protein
VRHLPASLIFIPATLIIYVLACIPVVNFVIWFVLMPLWPVVIVNGGLLGLAGEVFVRRLPKFWLLLPVAWFGGYGGMAWFDHQALSTLRSEVSRANVAVSVPFQANKQSLVYLTDNPDESLIQNYGLPVLYSKNGGDEGGYRSIRMVGDDVCKQLRDHRYSSAKIFPSWFDEESDIVAGGAFEHRFCMVSMPEPLSNPPVTLTVKERGANYRGMPVTYVDTTIDMPHGTRFTVRDGQASPLGWIPMPVIEYDPLSSQAKPHFIFYRNDFTPLNTEAGRFSSGTAVLARVLGLKRVSAADRTAGSSDAVSALIDESQRNVVRDETRRLDNALADVQAEIGSVPFNSLRGRQDIIVPRLERIMAAVERGVTEQNNGRNNAQQMFHLLEQAPTEQIAPFRNRIDALQTQDNWFKFNPSNSE